MEVTLNTIHARIVPHSDAIVEIGFLESGDATMSDASASCVSGRP